MDSEETMDMHSGVRGSAGGSGGRTPRIEGRPGGEGSPSPGAAALALHRDLLRVFHGDPAAPPGRASLDAGGRRAVRERMRDGTHASLGVVDELARRILASHDL